MLYGMIEPWGEILQFAMRAVAVYVAAIVVVRLGKTRTLGRATPLDIILALILGSMFSRSINGSAPFWPTVVAAGVLMLLHWGFTALSRKWSWWDRMMKGRAIPLIIDGQIQRKNLKSAEVSLDDLEEALRLRGGVDASQVAEARLERNGRISILTRQG